MTAKKDLKRRVRERQARTGESYTTARTRVVAQAEDKKPVIMVEEYLDLPRAAELGFKCDVVASARLLEVADPVTVLVRVRDALLATDEDPGTRILRAVALRGERPLGDRPHGHAAWARWWNELRRFGARVHAGIGGVSERGDLLALHVDGRAGSVLVMCMVGLWQPAQVAPARPPRLFLSIASDKALTPELPTMTFPR